MRLGRRCAQLALAGLMGMGAAAAQPPAPPTLVVKDGLSATEIALDQVPPGTTIDQFLLALYRLNPQAFAAGDLNRLLAQARLVLPTAEQANQVSLAQAREQLATLRQGGAAPGGPAPQAEPASLPAPAASEPAASPAPAQAAPEPAPAPAPATPTTPARPAWPLWLLAVVAALGVAVALARRKRQPAPSAPTAPQAAEAQAQGRFQPVLPGEPPAASPQRPATEAAAPKPALFDLDLTLDGHAPPLDLPRPAGLSKLPDLDLGHPAPKAATPAPLDLSRISLDLDSPPKDKP